MPRGRRKIKNTKENNLSMMQRRQEGEREREMQKKVERIKKREKIMRTTTFTCTSDTLFVMPRSALYWLISFVNKFNILK